MQDDTGQGSDAGGHDGQRGAGDRGPISVGSLLSGAWAATHGNKLRILLAVAVTILVNLAFGVVTGIVSLIFGNPGDEPSLAETLINFPINVVAYGFSAVMTAGLVIMAAKLSARTSTGIDELFRFLPRFVWAVLTQFLVSVMILLGLLLLVLPSIYLMVAYTFASPLALEKGLSPWAAMEASRRAVTSGWLTFFGLMLVSALLLMASVITLGIAYIWVVPLCVLAYGIAYRELFGIRDQGLDPEASALKPAIAAGGDTASAG